MEPRPVVVLHDGRWLSGWLLAARRDAGEPWRGLVRYTVAPGMQYYHRRDESELRRNESSSNGPVPARSIPLHCDELRSVEAMPDSLFSHGALAEVAQARLARAMAAGARAGAASEDPAAAAESFMFEPVQLCVRNAAGHLDSVVADLFEPLRKCISI
jgi:hypothetical protein